MTICPFDGSLFLFHHNSTFLLHISHLTVSCDVLSKAPSISRNAAWSSMHSLSRHDVGWKGIDFQCFLPFYRQSFGTVFYGVLFPRVHVRSSAQAFWFVTFSYCFLRDIFDCCFKCFEFFPFFSLFPHSGPSKNGLCFTTLSSYLRFCQIWCLILRLVPNTEVFSTLETVMPSLN